MIYFTMKTESDETIIVELLQHAKYRSMLIIIVFFSLIFISTFLPFCRSTLKSRKKFIERYDKRF